MKTHPRLRCIAPALIRKQRWAQRDVWPALFSGQIYGSADKRSGRKTTMARWEPWGKKRSTPLEVTRRCRRRFSRYSRRDKGAFSSPDVGATVTSSSSHCAIDVIYIHVSSKARKDVASLCDFTCELALRDTARKRCFQSWSLQLSRLLKKKKSYITCKVVNFRIKFHWR